MPRSTLVNVVEVHMALSASLNAGFLRAGTTLGSQLGHLRALFRLAGLTAVLTAMLAALIAARAARRVSPQLCARLRHLCKNSGALRVITLMGGRIEIVGSPPRGPCLFVSNHLGYLDVILLTALLDPVCVAKHDIAGWPVLRHLCKNSGALRVITLMGGRIEIVGSPPRGPCLFVSNHLD